MKKKKAKKRKSLKLRNRLARLLRHFSWVRFEEPMPKHLADDEEEVTNWSRMF